MSAHDLKKALKDVDRITLYRTLRVFESRGIIHKAHDGTQTVKYALCSEQCTDAVHVDDHVHFHCEICGNTVCLDKVQTPALDMPEGYHLTSLQIVAHGKCKNCIIA
jgi:Fur family ferric uptake transcriptional regulator